MTSKIRSIACLTLAFFALAALPGGATLEGVRADELAYEVWLVDQSNCTGHAFGGRIFIYDGRELEGADSSAAQPEDIIDLCGETDALAMSQTGSHPVRPHMLLFDPTGRRAVLSFVASGHVVIFDTSTRKPVATLRMPAGAGGSRQAHAAFPAPDGSFILVANQNGKLLHRIDSDFDSDTYVLNSSATLDLQTCTTPNGLPCQDPGLRPDNAPICPIVDRSGSLGFVTLRGGGLFVVDPRTTPMSIVGEYTDDVVHGNGCGGTEAGGSMFVNSGGGTAGNLHEFDLYRFPLTGYGASNPPDSPAPDLLFSDHGDRRDSHGMVASKHERYLWVFDRAHNSAEVFDVSTGARLGSVDLETPLTGDPSPDLGGISPSGNRLFVTLRGPNPLSGDPHVSTGATPGLGVIRLEENGRAGNLIKVVGISNVDGLGVERADAHGIAVRRLDS